MQANFPSKPKSHLIRLTDIAKKKARRRLLGSIFLLIIALIILLEVTARIKPIAINPKTIEINPKINATSIPNTAIHTEKSTLMASNPIMDKETASQVIQNTSASGGFKASVVNLDNNSDAAKVNSLNAKKDAASASAKSVSSPLAKLSPQIVSEAPHRKKLTPEEILNGATLPENEEPHFFVQVMASSNKNKLIQIEHELAKRDIKAMLQSSTHGDTTIYRLRIGPFTDRDTATNRLSELKDQLQEEQDN